MHNFSVLMASLLSLDLTDDKSVPFPSWVLEVSVQSQVAGPVGEALVLAFTHIHPEGSKVSQCPQKFKGAPAHLESCLSGFSRILMPRSFTGAVIR